MAKKRTCLVCGGSYTYCPHCGGNNAQETWRFLYDNENCRSIYHVYDEYRDNAISDEEAKQRLSQLNIEPVLAIKKGPVYEVLRKLYNIEETSENDVKTDSPEDKNGETSGEKDLSVVQDKTVNTDNEHKHIKYMNKKNNK